MGIATELRQSLEPWKSVTKITEETVSDGSIVPDGRKLQGQRESLDLPFENLFEALPGLIHGIWGGGNRIRLAAARVYSRQISWGASWT